MPDQRFEGHITGVGSASGVRVVVGHWPISPFGAFADVMVETPTGHRVLLAPSTEVAAFVAGGLTFTGITDVVEATLAAAEGFRADPTTPADVAAAEEWARGHARQRVASAVR